MSLRTQIAALLGTLLTLLIGSTYAIHMLVVMPTFRQLEQQDAERDLDRCRDAIGRDIELLSHSVLDWSAWDAVYDYVESRNKEFEASTLYDEVYEHAHVNCLCILNRDHQLV